MLTWHADVGPTFSYGPVLHAVTNEGAAVVDVQKVAQTRKLGLHAPPTCAVIRDQKRPKDSQKLAKKLAGGDEKRVREGESQFVWWGFRFKAPPPPHFYVKVLIEISHCHPLGVVCEAVHAVVHEQVLSAQPGVVCQHSADVIHGHHSHSQVGLGGGEGREVN